jgi:ABC-type polysaccharide/polyol phosphate export permease
VYPISNGTTTYVPKQAELLGMEIPVRAIYELNPIVQFVECYRDALYDLRFPPLLSVLYLIAWAAVMMGVGLAVFQRLDRRLAEEV